MGSCAEPNWTVLYDKIQGIENQVTKLQELYDGRMTTIEDATAKIQQTIQKWQNFSYMDIESESEIDRKSDGDGDIMGHIHHTDVLCSTDAASTEQVDTSDFIGSNTLDLGREGRGFFIQQESCSADIQPQSEPIRPNSSGEGNEHVDANPSFCPGLVEHYGDQEGFNDNTVPKRLNGEAASQETTPKDVASAAVGEDEPPGDEGLHDDTIPKNLNEETPSAVKPPENEPPSRDTGGETNCRRDFIAREDPERKYAEQQCKGIRDFRELIKNGNKALTKKIRMALRTNFCYLKENLCPVIIDLADYMFCKCVLSDHQLDVIESKRVTTSKCRYLVKDILLHSSETTFWVFMEALEKSNCQFIVDNLLKSLAEHDVNGQLRVEVDFPGERKATEKTQHCLQKARCSVEEYIFNNPDRKPSMCDAIRSVMERLNLTFNDTTRGSILMNMTFYTVEQLDAFWMWVKSRQPSPLSTSLTEVILTEEIRSMVPENLVLSLSTNMDLDEYLKKRRILLHGDLPMTSDDLNFGKRPLKEGTQSLSWLDIAGQPKIEANPKVLLEWAYESGYKDPLPVLTDNFPRTFTGYDEKDFRIERLHKLIRYKNGRISQLVMKSEELAEKLSKAEHKLKYTEDKLENIPVKQQVMPIMYNIRVSPEEILEKIEGEKVTDHRNKDNKTGQGTGAYWQQAQNANVPTNGVDFNRDGASTKDSFKQELPKESGSQASGGHAAAVYDDSDFHEEHVYGERVRGLSTVICVDTSGSMEGEAFTDMKNAIHKILDDAEYTSNMYDFKELIGLVECGSGSDGRTVVSLTDNYDRIRRALGCLSPSGMSPLATGIREAVHELKRHSGVLVVSRQMVPSRLLVFTDGIPTDENDYGSTVDLTRGSVAGKYKVMTAVQRPFNEPVSLQARINFIGCGKRCDRVFLENAAKAGKGKFFRADDKLDVRRLGGYYRRLVWVCRFICPFREKEFINQLVNTKNTFSTWMRATKSTEIFDTDLSDFDMDEMYEILQELIGPKALTDLDVEDLQRTALIQRELPLGIRVRRGPDWAYGDQDNDGPGTVSGYEKGGWVKVQWDHSNEDFVYRYGHDGRREVQVVNEPRILRDDEFIKPGVKVRRGPHWNSGNHDGGPGSIGTVYKVEEAGIVYVLWPTRVASNHRYGYDGRFEVELVEESSQHEGDEDGSGFITDDGKVALWQWNSNGNWTAYPKYVNTKLERSYRKRPSTSVEVNVAGLCQRINFESMTALCTDINETYEIQRTELPLEVFEAVRVGLEGY